MVSALCLYEDNRIHSAWKVLPNGNYDGMPIVEELPEGDISEYRYVNGQYIHDPLPEPEQPKVPSEPNYEARIVALEEELAAAKILLGVE